MKTALLIAISAAAISAAALPTYEPFTEFGPQVMSSGSNMVCVVSNHVVMTVGATGPSWGFEYRRGAV